MRRKEKNLKEGGAPRNNSAHCEKAYFFVVVLLNSYKSKTY